MRRIMAILVFGLFLFSQGSTSWEMNSASAKEKSYGCFKIANASSVRIRKRPYLWSKTLDYAQQGQKVVKNRRFCSIRRTWCRIRKGKVSGWVGKKFLVKTTC